MMKRIDTKPQTQASESGYTIVEVIVTAVVVSIFLILFFQSFSLIESQRTALIQQAKANDIARANLNLISNRTLLQSASYNAWTSAGASSCGSPSGWDLPSLGAAIQENKARGGAYQATLCAYPIGTAATYTEEPIKVISTVRYKINGSGKDAVVTHAKYIY